MYGPIAIIVTKKEEPMIMTVITILTYVSCFICFVGIMMYFVGVIGNVTATVKNSDCKYTFHLMTWGSFPVIFVGLGLAVAFKVITVALTL